MNRRGGSKVIKDAVKKLREGVPGIVIRTTVIVGFPGETEEEFLELCDFIAETRFDRLGCFPYSREEDTPAYDFEDQIDEDVKAQRAETIMHNQSNIALELCEEKIGCELEVVCEGYDPVGECYFGRSDADAPEIDGKVYFLGPKGMINEGDTVTVMINDVIDYDLIGEIK
jgi:ribosomal protein S12 methylthiotransferase